MSDSSPAVTMPTPFAAFLQPLEGPIKSKSTRVSQRHNELTQEAQKQGFELGLQEGFDKGYTDGQNQGRNEAFEAHQAQLAAELESFSAELQTWTNELQVSAQDWFAAAEQTLTDLVTSIARQVILSELTMDRSGITAIVHQAIEKTGISGDIRLRLNPTDRPLITNYTPDLLKQFAGLTAIKLVDDAQIGSGCIIETKQGVIDATTESKLAEIDSEIHREAA